MRKLRARSARETGATDPHAPQNSTVILSGAGEAATSAAASAKGLDVVPPMVVCEQRCGALQETLQVKTTHTRRVELLNSACACALAAARIPSQCSARSLGHLWRRCFPTNSLTLVCLVCLLAGCAARSPDHAARLLLPCKRIRARMQRSHVAASVQLHGGGAGVAFAAPRWGPAWFGPDSAPAIQLCTRVLFSL